MLERRHLSVLVPGLALLVLLALAYGAPLLAPYDPVEMDIAGRLKPLSAAHWLGQDEYGRDVLSRLLYGARVSLTVAIVASTIAMLIGVTLGVVGGYFRGIAELLTLRMVDIVLSFPPILLALLVVTLFGPGAVTLIACLAVLFAPGFARVTYGETLATRQLDYVEAVRALGAGSGRIITGTVLPNITGPIIVQFSLTIASAILIESGLSFLGLGRGAAGSVAGPDDPQRARLHELRCDGTGVALPRADPDRADLQCALRRAARCLRSQGADPGGAVPRADAGRARARGQSRWCEADNLSTHILTEHGELKAVDGISFAIAAGRDPGGGRRERLGQIDDRALDHGPGAGAGRADRRRHASGSTASGTASSTSRQPTTTPWRTCAAARSR